MWGVVQSAENLTPRGLTNTFASNEDPDICSNHSLDSFLLSKRRGDTTRQQESDSEFKYMIFVWNGKQANAMVKASAMTKGYELDDLVVKAKDSVLKVLFSGGVIRGKKLQRGSVFVFADVINQRTDREEEGQKAQAENPQQPSPEELKKAYETVYLLKWLFPPQQAFNVGQIEPKYSNFSNQFNV